MENYYNGYKSSKGTKIFNTYPVMNALNNKSISNYQTETGPMYEVKDNINFNYNGIKMDFMKLVTGNKVKIN